MGIQVYSGLKEKVVLSTLKYAIALFIILVIALKPECHSRM